MATVLVVAGCAGGVEGAPGTPGTAGPAGSARLIGPVGPPGLAEEAYAAAVDVGAAAVEDDAGGSGDAAATGSADAAASPRDGAPVVRRGPSTRTAPRELVAAVRPGQHVRVATVRVVGGTAHVDVVPAVGREEAERRIAAAQADPDVVAVQLDHRVSVARDAEASPAPTSQDATAVATDPAPLPTDVATSAPAPTSASPSPGSAASSPAGSSSDGAVRSDDAYRSEQWALDELRAERVWQVTRGAGQVVAVIDSGVDGTHPDLVGQVLPGLDLVAAGGDGWSDRYGHGTHVAGIVAAAAGNKIGIAGLAPEARILPIRVLDADGAGWDSDIATGLIWAADHGAGVVNLSLGGPDASDAVRAAVAYAIGRGAVVVAAAGNERTSGDAVNYPAGFAVPGELGVAATTRSRVSAGYSNTGSYVTLAAPGDGILSTLEGSYVTLSGTSMAAPYASAAVALVRAAAPSLDPIDVVRRLTSTADDLEGAGPDVSTGAGLVDPAAALCALGRCPDGLSTDPAASPSPSEEPAPDVPLTITVRVATARVPAGRPGVVSLTVADGDGPVAGALVQLAGAAPAVAGRTDAKGAVTLRITPARTTTWTLVATAGGHTRISTRWTLTVVPAVSVRWQPAQVTVTVAPARGQVVTVVRGSRVVARRRLPTTPSARLVLPVPRTGSARVTVSAAGGLAAVTLTRPSR